jgi:hypothetical protein
MGSAKPGSWLGLTEKGVVRAEEYGGTVRKG